MYKNSNNRAKKAEDRKEDTRPMPNKKRNQGKNKRYNRDAEIADTAMRDSRTNNPDWYARNPVMLEQATRFPFAYPLGRSYSIPANNEAGDDPELVLKVPGICTLYFVPTVGGSSDLQSPINTAARAIYTFIRNMNSGSKNYDQADLMMYLMAMDSLYMFHSVMKKIVGVARLYAPTNRYYPRAILEGLGADPDDVFANIADYQYFVNQAAYQIGMSTAPGDMSFYDRHQWMAEGLYVDHNSSKAQTYQFAPQYLWKFNNLGATGTSLTPVACCVPSGLNKLADWESLFKSLMANVIGDEDFAVMSGDILKAFGPNGHIITG